MDRQTDPQPTGALDSISLPRDGDPGRTAPVSLGERVRQDLGRDQVGAAAALLRQMLAADQGILRARVSRMERRRLIRLLPLGEFSDILDEAPTAAATIVRELEPGRAADLLDDVDSHTVADILQALPDERAAAIVAELNRPQDVVPPLQYPPDTAGGIMTTDFPRARRNVRAGNALDSLRLFGEDAEGFGWACVLDEDRRLVGAVSITQLALASPARSVADIAEQVEGQHWPGGSAGHRGGGEPAGGRAHRSRRAAAIAPAGN